MYVGMRHGTSAINNRGGSNKYSDIILQVKLRSGLIVKLKAI